MAPNHLSTFIATVLFATCILPACGDDNASSATTSSSANGGAAAGGAAAGGAATAAGGTGGTMPTAVCGNGSVDAGEVCFNGNVTTFAAGVTGALDLEVTDCDGDGDLDALVLGATAGINPHLSILRNNGDGTFAAGPSLTLSSTGVSGMAFDTTFNYRWRVPVVGGNTLNIVAISADCELSVAETFTLAGPVQTGVAAINIDKDIPSDYVMFVNINGSNHMVWYLSKTNNMDMVGPISQLNVVSAAATGLSQPKLPYAMFGNAQTGKVELVSANGILQKPQTSGNVPIHGTTGAGLADMVMVDVDGNNLGDVITANRTDHTITVVFNNFNQFTDPEPAISITGTGPTKGYNPIDVAYGDIDNDGDIDIITANEGDVGQGAAPSLTLLLNDGAGAFAIAAASTSTSTPVLTGFPFAVPAKPNEVQLVDLNGDNALDMVFLSGDGDVAVMLATP